MRALLCRTLTAGLVIWATVNTGPPAEAADCQPLIGGFPDGTLATSILLDPMGGVTSAASTALGAAMGQWNTKCSNVVPTFITSGSGSYTIPVVFIAGTSPSTGVCGGSCGCFSANDKKMRIYDESSNNVECGSKWEALIAHELGHVLGLDDAMDSDCAGSLMGPILTSTLMVTTDECMAVDGKWTTPNEAPSSPKDHQCTPVV